MSGVRRFMPANRLAKTLNDANGIMFEHALQRATQNVAAARESYEAALDEKLARVSQFASAAEADRARLPHFYRLAQDICADAGQLGYVGLAEAAKSLCDLLASPGEGVQFWPAIAVHRQALIALRTAVDPRKDPLARHVLEGLKRLSKA